MERSGRRGTGLDAQFAQACRMLDQGQFRRAFELFHSAARRGHSSSQLNLGVLHDEGRGVKANAEKALHWYKLALKNGSVSAAHNIATVYRDAGKRSLALRWFKRAVSLGDDDALVEIAKIYLKSSKYQRFDKLIKVNLARARASRNITPAYRDEAKKLLGQLKVEKQRNGRKPTTARVRASRKSHKYPAR